MNSHKERDTPKDIARSTTTVAISIKCRQYLGRAAARANMPMGLFIESLVTPSSSSRRKDE